MVHFINKYFINVLFTLPVEIYMQIYTTYFIDFKQKENVFKTGGNVALEENRQDYWKSCRFNE